MTHRQNISSGTVWEGSVGYSRAVRIGNLIEVAGTTAVDDQGNVVGHQDVYEQTKYILSKIEKTLKETGSSLQDVIRTRIFVTNIVQWEKIGRAHGEFFGDIRPATTMVEVSALITPDLLVEIEATAMVA